MSKAITEAMLKAARDAFREMCGITIYLPGEGDLDDFERARFEALEAVIAVALDMAPAQPVAIKPLEWVDISDGRACHRAAPTVGPVYWVEDDGFSEKKYHVRAHHLVLGNFDDLDDAKAAAQSDYEARIRSALVPPEDDESRVRDLEERLAKAAEALEPVGNLAMWTETADDEELCIMSVGTIRKMRGALEAIQIRSQK